MAFLHYRMMLVMVCVLPAASAGCTGHTSTPNTAPSAGGDRSVGESGSGADSATKNMTSGLTDGGAPLAEANGRGDGGAPTALDASAPSAGASAKRDSGMMTHDASMDSGPDSGGSVVLPPVTTPVAAPLSGPNETWENVLPESLRGGDVSGLDVLADPARPGAFYAFLSYTSKDGSLGVFKSLDWGATWARVSTDGSIEHGWPWGEAIAPDGSYLLASIGYPDNGNNGAWKSTDGGASWRSYSMSQDNDPYSFDIDSTNAKHVLGSMHAKDNIYESLDGGETWLDRGSAGTSGSNFIFFVTSTTWLSIPQDGGGEQTRRTTNSGATWSNVCPAQHAHGNAQIYVDRENGSIYIGGHGQSAVYRSIDGGASFTAVSSQRASTVWATGKYVYAMDPGATGAGTPPLPQRAARNEGTAWTALQAPSAMNNGMKRAAVAYDQTSKRWVMIGGTWAAGLWRYIESPY